MEKTEGKQTEDLELLHYTSTEVLGFILNDKTLKCNGLINVNDLYEKERRGIEQYAASYYVACFCHCQHEIVPFWSLYGGKETKKKVLLRFENFSNKLDQVIDKSYALTSDSKRIFFNDQDILNAGMSNVHDGFQFENREHLIIQKIQDVEYKPIQEISKNRYDSKSKLILDDGSLSAEGTVYDLQDMGKSKTINWEYEKETRLICHLSSVPNTMYYEHILLRLNEEMFRNLVIVANPWTDNEFLSEIKEIVNHAPISDEIKGTITVRQSELAGQLIDM